MKVAFILFICGCFISSCSYLPEEGAPDLYKKVEDGDYTIFYSGELAPSNAFLMVPGGLVDPHVYDCWLNRLVQYDTTIAVVLVKYPTNLPIMNGNKAMKVARDLKNFRHWTIGGHSLGGVVAASVVQKNQDFFDGLVLLASWSRAASDLSDWNGHVLSMYASEDQLTTSDDVLENIGYLPPGTTITSPEEMDSLATRTAYFEILGGNHSGFGCYGPQKGDGNASISAFDQQEQLIIMLKSFFTLLW